MSACSHDTNDDDVPQAGDYALVCMDDQGNRVEDYNCPSDELDTSTTVGPNNVIGTPGYSGSDGYYGHSYSHVYVPILVGGRFPAVGSHLYSATKTAPADAGSHQVWNRSGSSFVDSDGKAFGFGSSSKGSSGSGSNGRSYGSGSHGFGG